MPVYLSFLICTLSGASCHTIVPIDQPFLGLPVCQKQGEIIAARWIEQNPGWVVKRIRCTIGKIPTDSDAET